LQDHNADAEYRDYFENPFTAEELGRLIGSRPVTDFLSTRAKSYKDQGWGKKPPTRKQAIAAILKDSSLLKRPILADGKKTIIGFSQTAYERIVTVRRRSREAR
jgi:arsenate reductase-like glutaredoxin family protein